MLLHFTLQLCPPSYGPAYTRLKYNTPSNLSKSRIRVLRVSKINVIFPFMLFHNNNTLRQQKAICKGLSPYVSWDTGIRAFIALDRWVAYLSG